MSPTMRTSRSAPYARSAFHSRPNRTWSSSGPPCSCATQSSIQYALRSRKASASAAVTSAPGSARSAALPAKADADAYATIFKDGHDTLGAAIRVRPPAERRWREEPLRPLGNDRWRGSFEVDRCGRWAFSIAAWTDRVATWQHELQRKVEAGQEDLS